MLKVIVINETFNWSNQTSDKNTSIASPLASSVLFSLFDNLCEFIEGCGIAEKLGNWVLYKLKNNTCECKHLYIIFKTKNGNKYFQMKIFNKFKLYKRTEEQFYISF